MCLYSKRNNQNNPNQKKHMKSQTINTSKEFIDAQNRLERAFEKVNKASLQVHFISTYLEDGESSVQELEFWKSVSIEAAAEYKRAVTVFNACKLNNQNS